MIKAFAFDLDGTLTRHRTPIDDKNRKILEHLASRYKLVMVGAGSCARIHGQLRELEIDVIGNYGLQYAVCTDGGFKLLRDERVAVGDRADVEDRVARFRERHGFTEYCGASVEYHSSGCLTIAILGTEARIEDKLAFDPDRSRRREVYSEVVELFPDYNVFVGGSSSFDMAPKPYDKYSALDRWCSECGYDHSEVVFVGDDYGIGGNDESVYHSDFRFITTDDYTRLDEVLAPWLDGDVPDLDGLLGVKDDCPCGAVHSCEIEKVVIRKGAMNELGALARDHKKILLVDDENTRRATDNFAERILGERVCSHLTFSGEELVIPDAATVGRIKAEVASDTDLIVGVGSGVINDLCKYVSFDAGLKYIIVATAPSMDGYASKGAAMLFDGMKITTSARVPMAIIADTEVLKNAPMDMIRAGYGDIIGKLSCLNDWRLSECINEEPLCEYIYGLTYDTVMSVINMAEGISDRDEGSIAALMRALVAVGVAMAYMGNSRPASGSEHHLSHFFEVTGLLRGEPYFSHGVDVAYSTYVTAKLRQRLTDTIEPQRGEFDPTEWEERMRRVYRGSSDATAEGIIDMQKELGFIYCDRFDIYRDNWDRIKEILKKSPSPDEVEKLLSRIGLPLSSFIELYGEEKIAEAVENAMYLKDRYTVLWLYSQVK